MKTFAFIRFKENVKNIFYRYTLTRRACETVLKTSQSPKKCSDEI